MRRLAHDPASVMRRLSDTGLNLAYLAARRLHDSRSVGRHFTSLPGLSRMARVDFAWWPSAKDHMLVELIKARMPSATDAPRKGVSANDNLKSPHFGLKAGGR